MEYQAKNMEYDIIGPGIAGIAQRIASEYKNSEKVESKETSGLFALMHNDVISCSQNQF